MEKPKNLKHGFHYHFFVKIYPPWIYTLAMILFALALFIWIKFFLVMRY